MSPFERFAVWLWSVLASRDEKLMMEVIEERIGANKHVR